MTDQERRTVDVACWNILGYSAEQAQTGEPMWWIWSEERRIGICVPFDKGPSRDPALVVPLAEALNRAGWTVGEWDFAPNMVGIALYNTHGQKVTAYEATFQASLSLAAARALEAEGQDRVEGNE